MRELLGDGLRADGFEDFVRDALAKESTATDPGVRATVRNLGDVRWKATEDGSHRQRGWSAYRLLHLRTKNLRSAFHGPPAG